MIEHFLIRCKQRLQLNRAKINIHIRKTLWQANEPAKLVAYCAKALQSVDCLDITPRYSREVSVVTPLRAKELSEALYAIVDMINHDQSVRHTSYLGFFTDMNGREFITDKERGAVFDNGRHHIQFHLLAIETIANFINEAHEMSDKEYAQSNKRILTQHLKNFQLYLDSLLAICKPTMVSHDLLI